MRALLVIRPSSLGDIVHSLSLVSDVAAQRPDFAVDWVAEEGFVPLVRLDARVRHVIPVAFRRWRGAPLARGTWHEFADFRHALRAQRYDCIIDLQEQVKGALIARLARGRRHGFDRHSIREPIATALHDTHHRIERAQHFIDKARALAGAALGYVPGGPPRWQWSLPAPPPTMPAERYALLFHGTSRADKQWPEAHWRALIAHLSTAGIRSLLPWGSEEERARSVRLAAGAARADVPPRQDLPALAALARHAELVVGVDTGLTHLSAAIGTPTVAIFTTTDAALAGVARDGPHAVDLGGNGVVPAVADVITAAGALLRAAPHC
ncbi:MAG: lipopolysaccharide heptosyltransferase I [Burkholderiales bacterium]